MTWSASIPSGTLSSFLGTVTGFFTGRKDKSDLQLNDLSHQMIDHLDEKLPDDSLVGRMCVCGVSDGRVLIKALKHSQNAGLWHLLSNTEPPIYDVGLDWAAPVREMRPR